MTLIKYIRKIPFLTVSIIKYIRNKNKFKKKRNLAISLVNPSYKPFYKTIIDPLLQDDRYNVICLGSQMYDLDTYSEFIQIFAA